MGVLVTSLLQLIQGTKSELLQGLLCHWSQPTTSLYPGPTKFQAFAVMPALSHIHESQRAWT